MRGQRARRLWLLIGFALLAWGLLAGCERPDPQDAVVEAPTQTPTLMPTSTPLPTQPPVQVYVVVVQPTPGDSQPVASNLPVSAPTIAPTVPIPSPTPVAPPEPTPLPADFYIGWVWTNSLIDSKDQVTVVKEGLTLHDRPSQEGNTVGTVIGLADVIIVGQKYCGYTPIMVDVANMLLRTTPHPAVLPAEPLPTEPPPFTPTARPVGNVTNGWAYTDELTLLGETAISGALGINLRSDPCLAATNLGFIPAGSNLIVTGLPNEDYTPVRVNNDILQPPFEFPELAADREDDVLSSRSELELNAFAPTVSPTPFLTTTPSPTVSPTPSPTP